MTIKAKQVLLGIAREAIRSELTGSGQEQFRQIELEPLPEVCGQEGVFVTLKKRGIDPKHGNALRGCIGNIIGQGPLYRAVRHLACESAFRDPRFRPVHVEELDSLVIELSVLTVPRVVDAWSDIVIGRDGVLLTRGNNRAVFLPQVAGEQGWSLEETLGHLSMKAGMPASAWQQSGCRFEVFQAEVFDEASVEVEGSGQ